MPLLNRRPYTFNSTDPADLDPDEQVWVVKATGEVCRSYEAYVQKVKLYEEPVWTCKYSGKGGMTLEEAQAAEHKALTALKGFPKDLEEQVCRTVHHSLLRLDELVGSIYDSLRPAAAQEEQSQQAAQQQAVGGEQQPVQQDSPSPFGSKENEPQRGASGTAADAAAGEKPAAAGDQPAEGAAGAVGAAAAEPATAKKPEGDVAAVAGEGSKSGKKAKTPKAPVFKPVLRTYIIEIAEQQGPEHATKQVWVLKPELREQFGLPAEVPADIQEKLAASVKAPKKKLDAPKGLGTKLPAKKEGKKSAAGADAGSRLVSAPPGGNKGAAAAAAGGDAEGTTGKAAKEKVHMVRVEAKSLEEVEQQYKEGTVKHALVTVLKAVQPQALTVQGIIDKAKELGIQVLEEKQKTIPSALATDPNFLRLSKGAYSLHCFHPDKEQLVKAPQPKEPKQSKKAASAAAAAAAGTPAPDAAEAVEGGASTANKEKEAVPMVAVKAKLLEEVEQQYKEGTVKHALVTVLKAVQPQALTATGIMEKAKELELQVLEEKQKAIPQALANDPTFLRLSKGAYSLHCFHPDKEQLVKAPQPKKRKMSEHFADGEEPGSKAARQEGSAAPQGGEEVDSITKAEQQVKQTRRALTLHRGALEKAQAEYDAAKAAFEEDKKKSKTPVKERPCDIHIPAEQLAQFELTEEERQFKGEADDRKALLEHRQKLQARAKELEKAKKAFLEAERQKREKASKESVKEMRAAEIAFRKAERALEHERRATESAEKVAAAAEKKLEKEKEKAVRGEEKAKEREEREKQKQAEREERERRRAEAAKAKEEAKRYPMEDLELLQELRQKATEAGEEVPPEDVEQPHWMGPEDSQRLSTALYVADFITQFSKQLGCRALNYEHLQKVLEDATRGGGGEDDYNVSVLHAVYERLLRVVLDDLRAEEEATAQEKRWGALLSEGTWPEVLRRFVLTRAAEEEVHMRPDRPAIMSATMLAFDSVDRLTHDQHLALLRFLCDAVLDSEKMRGVLQRREDEAVDVKRDVREELAEQRKQLKEMLDAEKEERKRKREEERRAAEEEKEKAAAEAAAAAAAAGGVQGGAAAAAAAQQDNQKPQSKQAAGATAPMEVDEPSFELPERLREYTGSPDDKKALLQWRQEQQAEKRRLEKERNKWVAEQLRRQREQEAAEKAAREAEKAKQREKEEKEEAIIRAQEALEEKLEKYSVRRVPLGLDRHHRRYWWGLAGHRPVLYVENAEGCWGSISTLAELDALVASLDRRGVRELALAEAVEKRFQSISIAMQRAERAAAAAGGERVGKQEKERAEPPRRSGRQTQQTEFFDPVKAGSKAADSDAAASGLAALFGPAECASIEQAAEEMLELQSTAGALVSPPEGCSRWKEWTAAVKPAADGELEEGTSGKPTAAAVRNRLQAKLMELEGALLAESVGGLAAYEDSSDEEGSEGADEGQASKEGSPAGEGGASIAQSAQQVLDVVDDLFSPTKRPDVAYLWKTQLERNAWQADLRQASTAARLAYCAAVLKQQAEPMLATLRKASGGGKKGGKTSGKAAAGGILKAAVAGGGKEAAAASSRPVSRTNSATALDAVAGKKDKGGKRKAAPPPPDNMRVTRSRH